MFYGVSVLSNDGVEKVSGDGERLYGIELELVSAAKRSVGCRWWVMGLWDS